MSEYQYIAFRAIDAPVSKQNLAFMRKQSSRAEITPWAFDNTYSFGDFHGDAPEMLRRGYDFHLHFADFGIRKLMIRLPNGLPDPAASKRYFDDGAVELLPDKTGPGAILTLEQSYEPGDIDEELFDIESFVERLLPLRIELMDGDLRPLYIAYLAAMFDMNHDYTECKPPPIPAGLKTLTDAQEALATFSGLDKWLLAAAAEQSAPLGSRSTSAPDYTDWLKKQSEASKITWLNQLLMNPNSTVLSKVRIAFAAEHPAQSWPTTKATRTLEDLRSDGEALQKTHAQQRAAARIKARAEKLAELAATPNITLKKVDALVEEGSSKNYKQAANLLADLREALSGTPKADLAQQHALILKGKYATRKVLISALKQHGFLPTR